MDTKGTLTVSVMCHITKKFETNIMLTFLNLLVLQIPIILFATTFQFDIFHNKNENIHRIEMLNVLLFLD